MDCSGMLVYILDKMGYEVDKNVTVAKLIAGEVSGIVFYNDVVESRQGDLGTLNFYKFEGDEAISHVNYGVGQNAGESKKQVVDASQGDTWQTGRNERADQIIKAKSDRVNQTYVPFSTKTAPIKQARIDFSKLKKKEIR